MKYELLINVAALYEFAQQEDVALLEAIEDLFEVGSGATGPGVLSSKLGELVQRVQRIVQQSGDEINGLREMLRTSLRNYIQRSHDQATAAQAGNLAMTKGRQAMLAMTAVIMMANALIQSHPQEAKGLVQQAVQKMQRGANPAPKPAEAPKQPQPAPMAERVGYGLTECVTCGDVFCHGHRVDENCSAGAVGAGAIAGNAGMLFGKPKKKAKKTNEDAEIIRPDFTKNPHARTQPVQGVADIVDLHSQPIPHKQPSLTDLIAERTSPEFAKATWFLQIHMGAGTVFPKYRKTAGVLHVAHVGHIKEFRDGIFYSSDQGIEMTIKQPNHKPIRKKDAKAFLALFNDREIMELAVEKPTSVRAPQMEADVEGHYKGLQAWVRDYIELRKYGNLRDAKNVRDNIRRQIEKYNLDPNRVWGSVDPERQSVVDRYGPEAVIEGDVVRPDFKSNPHARPSVGGAEVRAFEPKPQFNMKEFMQKKFDCMQVLFHADGRRTPRGRELLTPYEIVETAQTYGLKHPSWLADNGYKQAVIYGDPLPAGGLVQALAIDNTDGTFPTDAEKEMFVKMLKNPDWAWEQYLVRETRMRNFAKPLQEGKPEDRGYRQVGIQLSTRGI